jgi:hypothetical protein
MDVVALDRRQRFGRGLSLDADSLDPCGGTASL